MLCSNPQITVLIHYQSYLSVLLQSSVVGDTSTGGTRESVSPAPHGTPGQPGCTAPGPRSLITPRFPKDNPGGQGNPRPLRRSPDTTAGPGCPLPAPRRDRRYRGNGAAEPRGPVTRSAGPARALPGRRPVATATITPPSPAASLTANAEK